VLNRTIKRLFPEEIFVIGFFILFFLYFKYQDWQIIFYERGIIFYLFFFLVFSFFVFFLINFFRLAFSEHNRQQLYKKSLKLFYDVLRIWAVFYLVLIIEMNIKINVPLINGQLYDSLYHQFDIYIKPFGNVIIALRDLIQGFVDLGKLYVYLYEALFLLTFIILYWQKPKFFRPMYFATIFAILMGAVFYCVMPAIGPFYYSPSPSPYVQDTVSNMLMRYNLYRITNGEFYTYAMIVQGIAAMPSLHVANTLIFLYFIYKYARRWTWLYLISFIYIVIDAMYTKYHYGLDVIIGFLLGLLSIYICEKIYQILDKNKKLI
jgi:membrane-associated phospholipid phosphatase